MKNRRLPNSTNVKSMASSKLYFIVLLSSVLIISYPTIVLGSDVTGTNLPNTIYGTMGDDKITGKDGKDELFGLGGNDEIRGGNGDDYIVGDLGKDTLEGDDGDDVIQGGSGADTIDGGKGNDTLLASFALGPVSFRDYAADKITCGAGFDTVYINPVDGDTASPDCESIITETSQ